MSEYDWVYALPIIIGFIIGLYQGFTQENEEKRLNINTNEEEDAIDEIIMMDSIRKIHDYYDD